MISKLNFFLYACILSNFLYSSERRRDSLNYLNILYVHVLYIHVPVCAKFTQQFVVDWMLQCKTVIDFRQLEEIIVLKSENTGFINLYV